MSKSSSSSNMSSVSVSGGSQPSLHLWVQSEPFSYGALGVPPHPRLSPHNLKKIISYAKNKGNCYPNLSYPVWNHIACNKLQLSEDVAWAYFETFLILSGWSVDERKHWDSQLAKCTTKEQTEDVRMGLVVDVHRFVLLLFVQQLHKISLRASLVSGSDEWPMRARSPELEGGRSNPSGSKSLDEHGHHTFVLNHLKEILEIFAEPEGPGGKGDASTPLCLTSDAVKAMGFIIAGSIDSVRINVSRDKVVHMESEKYRHVKSLYDLATMSQMQAKSGYHKSSRSFSFPSLLSWIRTGLQQNPFGISSCIASGRRLSWPLAGEHIEHRADNKRGKIATNAHIVPRDHIKGNKIIIMSQVCKQTVARSSHTLEWSSVKIHRCHYSSIYLLSPLRSVNIEKCRHSTVVLGAVDIAVHMNACEHVALIAATRRISISGSTLCNIHVMTPTRPLILSSNDTIILGPYHTVYPKLEEHMSRTGLTVNPNLWDNPVCLGTDHQDGPPVWELIKPEEFYPFTVPFSMDGSTKSNPYTLPEHYEAAVVERDRQIDNWQKMVKQAGLTREQRKQFQNIVESRFQDWLADTGHKRELDGLVVTSAKK